MNHTKMPKLIIIIFISLFAISVKAQNQEKQNKLDSLSAIWEDKTQADTTRFQSYSQYIWEGFMFSNPDSALVLAEAMHEFAREKDFKKAQAKAYNLQGVANSLKGNHSKAFDYFNKCLKIQEQIGDQIEIAKTLNNIGIIYENQAAYSRALKYYVRGLEISTQLGDETNMARLINNIGVLYNRQGDFQKSLEYYFQSLEIHEKMGNDKQIASTMSNIGSSYFVQGNIPKALEFKLKALQLAEEWGDDQNIAGLVLNIGHAYEKQGDYPKALDHYNRSLSLYQKVGDRSGTSLAFYTFGNFHRNQGDYLKALKYCQKGLKLAEEIEVLRLQGNNCKCLYETYKNMGKGNEALVYLERIGTIEDSLNVQETAKKLQQMEFAKQVTKDSLATVEKERVVEVAHLEEVRQKNQTRNILFGVSGLILLGTGGIYSRLRYVRKSKAIIEKEKDRSENLLLNILPAEIAEELKIKGKADARDFDMVSILFTDFKGFTEQSAKLSAADLVNEINTCFEAFDTIMGKYGVEKIKTIGDAYMAAGGLPVPTDDSVKNTVLAAFEMQEFIRKRKLEMDAKGLPSFQMRVGINTGPVVAGIVGVKKFQYDIWGDTVNTASRIESNGEVDKVNISQSTYELLKKDTDLVFESRGEIAAKGKGKIGMYFVSKKS